MKKIIYILFALIFILSSCSNENTNNNTLDLEIIKLKEENNNLNKVIKLAKLKEENNNLNNAIDNNYNEKLYIVSTNDNVLNCNLNGTLYEKPLNAYCVNDNINAWLCTKGFYEKNNNCIKGVKNKLKYEVHEMEKIVNNIDNCMTAECIKRIEDLEIAKKSYELSKSNKIIQTGGTVMDRKGNKYPVFRQGDALKIVGPDKRTYVLIKGVTDDNQPEKYALASTYALPFEK